MGRKDRTLKPDAEYRTQRKQRAKREGRREIKGQQDYKTTDNGTGKKEGVLE
jgi:hypothetical protein